VTAIHDLLRAECERDLRAYLRSRAAKRGHRTRRAAALAKMRAMRLALGMGL
jgi:hypothetical protein